MCVFEPIIYYLYLFFFLSIAITMRAMATAPREMMTILPEDDIDKGFCCMPMCLTETCASGWQAVHEFASPGENDEQGYCDVVSALGCIQKAKETRNQKYYKYLKLRYKKLKRREERERSNKVQAYLELLEAELAVLSGNQALAATKYKAALQSSTRKRDTALVNECFGEFLRYEMFEPSAAASHIKRSIQIYKKCGNMPKVNQLRKKHGAILHLGDLPTTPELRESSNSEPATANLVSVDSDIGSIMSGSYNSDWGTTSEVTIDSDLSMTLRNYELHS